MRRKGKVYIAEALIFMLLTDELEDIKICDICRRAGVSRMTYYRYFNEKSEVLEFYMDYLFEEFLKEEAKSPEKMFRSVEHIVDCLEYFKEHAAFAICLYKAGLEGIMLKAINRYMNMKLEEEFAPNKNKIARERYFKDVYPTDEVQRVSNIKADNTITENSSYQVKKRSFMLYAYAGSIYNCYMQWILDDFSLDVLTLAQIIAHL